MKSLIIALIVAFVLSTTLPFVGHHPIQEYHNENNKEDHVAHMLSRACVQHNPNLCQTSLQHIACR